MAFAVGNMSMRFLYIATWLICINGIVLLAATSHLRKTSRPEARGICSVALFLLTMLVVTASGFHRCDEGGTPSFVIFSSATITASLAWFSRLTPWQLRGLAAMTITLGMISGSRISSSYHREAVTGNPAYSAGRFWHTPFTGQYPRDREKTPRYKTGK